MSARGALQQPAGPCVGSGQRTCVIIRDFPLLPFVRTVGFIESFLQPIGQLLVRPHAGQPPIGQQELQIAGQQVLNNSVHSFRTIHCPNDNPFVLSTAENPSGVTGPVEGRPSRRSVTDKAIGEEGPDKAASNPATVDKSSYTSNLKIRG